MKPQYARNWTSGNKKRKQTQSYLWLSQLIALGLFPGYSIGRKNPGGAWQTPWDEEMELRVQGDQSSYSAQERVLERRALRGERTPEIHSIQLNNEQCVHVRNLPETRKEPPERIRGDSARCSYRLGIWYLFLPTRLGNLKIHGHQVEYSEGSRFTS